MRNVGQASYPPRDDTLTVVRVSRGGTGATTAAAARTNLGAAAAAHTHPLGDLTQSGATTGQVATWNGTIWVPQTPAGGGGGDAGWLVHAHTVISGSPNAVEVALPTGDNGRIVRVECFGLGITADAATNLWVYDISRVGGSTWVTTGETSGHIDRQSDGARTGTSRANTTFFGCLYPGAGVTIDADERYNGHISIAQVFSAGPIGHYSEWWVVSASNGHAITRHSHTDSRTAPTFANARVDRLRIRTLNNNTLVNGGLITVLYRSIP